MPNASHSCCANSVSSFFNAVASAVFLSSSPCVGLIAPTFFHFRPDVEAVMLGSIGEGLKQIPDSDGCERTLSRDRSILTRSLNSVSVNLIVGLPLPEAAMALVIRRDGSQEFLHLSIHAHFHGKQSRKARIPIFFAERPRESRLILRRCIISVRSVCRPVHTSRTRQNKKKELAQANAKMNITLEPF